MKIINGRTMMVGGLMLLLVAVAGFSMANDDVKTEKENLMKRGKCEDGDSTELAKREREREIKNWGVFPIFWGLSLM